PEEDARLRSRLARLAAIGGWDGPAPTFTSPTAPDPDGSTVELAALVGAAYRALADAGSDLVVASLEDAVGQTHRPNLPGTVDEHPNWSLALPVLIEDLDRTDPRNWLRYGLPPRTERRPQL
ncbi:MAG TPA: 4-alpha-glucanotransferase, partial [Microthrixaceae bacterium]|nr:4-alpha-glucanotransferase [Microthrixaceae bacterium]